jgi:hypothetical protein
MDRARSRELRRNGDPGDRHGSGIVALVFLLRADGLRLMRFEMTMGQPGMDQCVRQVAGMDTRISMLTANMGVRERRKELRQREQQQCSEM